MSKIIFHNNDGTTEAIDANTGQSVMQVAVQSGVPGIIGECGGDMSCATCHVYVADQSGFRSPSADEEDLLELADDLRPTSRLGCQLKLSDHISEVVVEVPPHE